MSTTQPSLEQCRSELLELIRRRAYLKGDFTLSSGRKSSYYVDAKQVTLHPCGLYLVSKLILEELRERPVEAVGGLTLGADPIAAGTALLSELEGRPLTAFIVRKEAKGHGSGRRIEGPLQPGMRVAIVEDVCTTGASALSAIRGVEAFGCQVEVVVFVLDRQEGMSEEMRAYPVVSLFKRSELEADD